MRPSVGWPVQGFQREPRYLWRLSGSGGRRDHILTQETGRDTRHKQRSLMSNCQTFQGPSGSKKGGWIPKVVGEAESTLLIAKEAAACKVYLRVLGKGIEPLNSSPNILQVTEIKPLEIHSF